MAGAFISGTFNAFAFAGAGFLFQKISKGDYQKEMKRHNLAMEQLAKARDKWNQQRLAEIDRISNLRYDKEIGEKDLQETNHDLIALEKRYEASKPLLSQFYKPGPKMTEYMNIVKFATTIPAVYGLLMLL